MATKCKVGSLVVLNQDIEDEEHTLLIPTGTEGVVIEVYENPEVYYVDIKIPNKQLVGDYEFHNIVIEPKHFDVLIYKDSPLWLKLPSK